MSFVQASFLFALAALSIPVLVHLLSRWQVQTVELGTMRFLREVLVETSSQRRIRRWLLLTIRICLLGLLAMLFARPFFFEPGSGDAGRVRIVMIDRSASMAMSGTAGRLIDDALAAAADSQSELGQEAKVVWAWFDRFVTELPGESGSVPQPPSQLTGETDYGNALRWARDRIARDKLSGCDVVLITDLQQSGFTAESAVSDALDFPGDVPLKIIDVGRQAASNLAITSVTTATTNLPSDRPLAVQATLFNYGTLPVEEATISLTAKNDQRQRRTKKTISLPGEQAQEIVFDVGRLEPGLWQLTVELDIDDDMVLDNRRRLAVNVVEPHPVLILDSAQRGGPQSSASYFLRTALDQSLHVEATVNRFKTTVVSMDQASAELRANRHSMIIVSDSNAMSLEQIEELEQQVRNGQRLLVFAGDSLNPEITTALVDSGLAPGQLKSMANAGVSPFRIRPLSAAGLMLEPFQDPQRGDLGKLAFQRVLSAELFPNTKILARLDAEHAAITQHELGAGRVVWFMASAAGGDSAWTASPLFLPLVQQMVSDLLGLTGEGLVRLRLVGDVPVGIDGAATSPGEPRFDTPGFVSKSGVTYVVNSDPRESDTTRGDKLNFYKQYGLTDFQSVQPEEGATVIDERRHEIWPWLATIALVLVLTEFFIANRTPS